MASSKPIEARSSERTVYCPAIVRGDRCIRDSSVESLDQAVSILSAKHDGTGIILRSDCKSRFELFRDKPHHSRAVMESRCDYHRRYIDGAPAGDWLPGWPKDLDAYGFEPEAGTARNSREARDD